MRILVVDDSVTFRTAIKAALAGVPTFEVAGTAANGLIALAKLRNERFDVMILDLEMPECGGVEVLRTMQAEGLESRTLIFAAPTAASYAQVREALTLGAEDFVAKPAGVADEGPEGAIRLLRDELVPRLQSLAAKVTPATSPAATDRPSVNAVPTARDWQRRSLSGFLPNAIVIASSTGGPIALERVFRHLRAPSRVPVFVVQHMPAPFTRSLAERLQEVSGVAAAEGRHQETVVPDRIYVAPAGFHMRLIRSAARIVVDLSQGARINYVCPAADPLFETAAGIYRQGLMGFVLTGMGEDGKIGACAVKQAGGGVMIQDQATSVVWGMPGAVHEVGAFDQMGTLEDCGALLRAMCA